MRLNADIIYHNLKQALNVEIYGMCENDLVLHRPEFYLDRTSRFEANHVYVCSADHLPAEPVIEDNVLLICLGDAPQRDRFEQRCGILSVSGDEDIFRVFNPDVILTYPFPLQYEGRRDLKPSKSDEFRLTFQQAMTKLKGVYRRAGMRNVGPLWMASLNPRLIR